MLTTDKKYDLTCIELFTGCGGLALGLKNAGINSCLMVEIDKNAALTLKKNFPNNNIVNDDVKNISYRGITADIVSGGFPCQAFSHAGFEKRFRILPKRKKLKN